MPFDEGGFTITKGEYRRNFPKRLMKLTAERGWSYYDVASHAGMSPSTLYKYYHQCIMPGVDTLAALADVFDMTIDELIGRSVNKQSESERLPSPASEA